jgi:hypothetical protein
MTVWLVYLDQLDHEGELTAVEVVIYATERTARQHAERDGGYVAPAEVLTKLRSY